MAPLVLLILFSSFSLAYNHVFGEGGDESYVKREIASIHHILRELQDENENTKQTLKNILTENKDLKLKVWHLQAENSKTRSEEALNLQKMAGLIKINAKLENDLEELKIDSQNLKQESRNLRQDVLELTAKNAKIKQKMENGNDNRKRLLMPSKESGNSSMAVAFSAALSHIVTLGQDQLVEYDKVITNIGQSYDPRHSHFIAPVAGVYLLSACGFSQGKYYAHLDIVKNGKAIGYLFTHDHNMGTQVVVAVLEKGDMVWVKHRGDPLGSAVLYGTTSEQFITFSGALIHQM